MNQEEVIIIGAGVSGITTGLVLQLLGYQTKIYAKETVDDFYHQGDPGFASRYPAASVIPHTVFTGNLKTLFRRTQNFFHELYKDSFNGLTVHKHFEVFEFEKNPPAYLELMNNVRSLAHQDDIPKRKEDEDLYGWVFDCFFTDWPVYFPNLTQLYLDSGGNIKRQSLTTEEIPRLPSDIIINCSGLGSCHLFEDDAPHEISRGHLLFIKDAPLILNENKEIISYNYTPEADVYSDKDGNPVDVYCYPRNDGWILGGSRQYGTVDESGNWSGGKNFFDGYSVGDISYPRQMRDLNKEILKKSYGLELETYQHATAFKGYRYIRSRNNGLRLEEEELDDKLVIHNYGHGGAGIALSWGASLDVARMTASAIKRAQKGEHNIEQHILNKLRESVS